MGMAMNGFTIDGDVFKLIINEEGQYSIWPAEKSTPSGWKDLGFSGNKAECSDYADKNWTDMRPLSLQKAL
jgi:MbtH protein